MIAKPHKGMLERDDTLEPSHEHHSSKSFWAVISINYFLVYSLSLSSKGLKILKPRSA